MRQNDELAKVKAKIKALTEKTVSRGCTENEALLAATLIGKLLDQYNLTMEEIDVREERCVTLYHKRTGKNRQPVDYALTSIATFCECKVWLTNKSHGWKTKRTAKGTVYKQKTSVDGFAAFGHEADAQMAIYLYTVIERALATELRAFKRSDLYRETLPRFRRSATTSFAHGLVDRVASRLRKMKDDREAALKAQAVTGTALVVLKGQIIQEEFKKTGLKLTTSQGSRRVRDGEANLHGHRAGDRVNLSRPLDGDNTKIAGLIGG